MFIRSHNQQGFSLIELMIAMSVGLLVIAGIMSVFSKTVATNNSTLQATRLNQEMLATMELISDDLRRAGYFRDAHCTTDASYLSTEASTDISTCSDGVGVDGASQTNPFDTIEIGTSVTANDCVLFSYDANNNGVFEADEATGYRLNQASGTGFVARRTNGALCNQGGWGALSDATNNNITLLQFDASGSRTVATANGVLSIRKITITMSGQLVSDPTVKLTLQNTVRVLNDRWCAGAACATGI